MRLSNILSMLIGTIWNFQCECIFRLAFEIRVFGMSKNRYVIKYAVYVYVRIILAVNAPVMTLQVQEDHGKWVAMLSLCLNDFIYILDAVILNR